MKLRGIPKQGMNRIAKHVKAEESELSGLMEILEGPLSSLLAIDGLDDAIGGDPSEEFMAVLVYDTPDDYNDSPEGYIHNNVLSVADDEMEGVRRAFSILEAETDSDPRGFDYNVFDVSVAELRQVADKIQSLIGPDKSARKAQDFDPSEGEWWPDDHVLEIGEIDKIVLAKKLLYHCMWADDPNLNAFLNELLLDEGIMPENEELHWDYLGVIMNTSKEITETNEPIIKPARNASAKKAQEAQEDEVVNEVVNDIQEFVGEISYDRGFTEDQHKILLDKLKVVYAGRSARKAQEADKIFNMIDLIQSEIGVDALIGELTGILVQHVDRGIIEQELTYIANRLGGLES